MNGTKLLALLVLSVVISGCAREQVVVPAKPLCSPTVIPVLPVIDRGALWDKLGDKDYRTVESYIDSLWGVVDEQQAVLDVVCQKPVRTYK